MRTMDIESTAAPQSSYATQGPVHGEALAQKEEDSPLCAVREENKVLREKLQRLTIASQVTREPSLDVCRGFATAMMILVKRVGNSVPVMNYAPWDGINFADFGPPIFLFLAGVSTALAHDSHHSRIGATGAAFSRSAWLFGLGILLEGGFFNKESLSFGIDTAEFRVFGTLQRIAVANLCTSLCEIWAPGYRDSRGVLWKKYYLHWAMTALLPAASAAILYGLHVPDWSFSLKSANSTSNSYENDNLSNPSPCIAGDISLTTAGESLSASAKNITFGTTTSTSTVAAVICGGRGLSNTGPACNAAAHIDRLLLGMEHMNPTAWYKRLPVCRENLPHQQEEIPAWCVAPFESEGILSTLSATATSLIGLHFGHVMVRNKQQHLTRLWSWTLPSASLVIVGVTLHNVGLSFNRQLYSFSYICFTAGTAGTLLSTVYLLVQANGWTSPFSELLQLIGRHSLLLFGLLQCDVLQTLLQGFYHKCPQNNVLSYLRSHHRIVHRILPWL
jgi:heparan-alpha-glucosaminide N-acetyltransferase